MRLKTFTETFKALEGGRSWVFMVLGRISQRPITRFSNDSSLDFARAIEIHFLVFLVIDEAFEA